MSSYSNLNMDIKTKNSLSMLNIEKINLSTIFDCGLNSYKNICKNNINFNITFNRGLKQIIEIINLLETFISYDKITQIGTFYSECILIEESKVFACNNKILIVEESIKIGTIYDEYIYHINDLRNKNEKYSQFIDKNSNNKIEESLFSRNKFIKEFLKIYDVKE